MLPFDPADLHRYRDAAALHLAPGGALAACELHEIDAVDDRKLSQLWAVPLDGSREPWQLTTGPGYSTSPRWSPDGTQLAFLSDRANGLQQIHVLPAAGGEARQIGSLAGGVTAFEWSPDGSRFLATSPVRVDCEARGAPPDPSGNPPPDRGPTAPQVAWRLPYKADGEGFILDREFHLFAVDAQSGAATQITSGAFSVRNAAWSPDGTQIAYCRTREGRFAHCTDLWIANADGRNARQITFDLETAQFPSWSPDGRWIVFSGNPAAGDPQRRLWVYGLESAVVTPVGDESLEVAAPQHLAWLPDSTAVIALLARRGRHCMVRISIPDGEETLLADGDRHLPTMHATADRIVFTSVGLTSPSEVHVMPLAGGAERCLTSFNAWWSDKGLPVAVARRFTVPDGAGGVEDIEGWLLQPDTPTTGSRPLLVDMHGGPASYALLSYPSHAHWHVLVSRGWCVLALNAVGSSSYGRDFATRLRGHWGERDFAQVLAAVDALQQEGLVDERLAIAGGSYGGYLSAWAIGHSTRFRAAVVQAPVTNLETHYGTSDSGFYSDPYSMLGEPFIERELSRRLSPMKCVEKARTPTLILQGEKDERCPKCQAEELFVTLMCAGSTPAELVMYPGAGHQLTLPSHRLDAITRLIAWLERWIDVPVPTGAAEPERALQSQADTVDAD